MRSAVLALFLSVFPSLAIAEDFAPYFDRLPLTITTAGDKTYAFTVEMAVSAKQREYGLMFRETMAPDAGMLFDFGESRPVMMWMKDTVLPLDMLFILADGRVHHIQPDAVPYSQNVVSSNGSVKFVLELNAGTAAQLGIKKGDLVVNRRIGNTP